ncbi:hypothetical protein H4S04_005401 [Coemansia sp. S16]|nr:hypothetical protein H4S04_005401 [Coemansia sp. S16]
MSTMFGSETGPVDYLCCDIFVQANMGSSINEWQAVADPGVLQAWVAKLFAFFFERTEGFVWNREPPRLFANLANKGKQLNKDSSRSHAHLCIGRLHIVPPSAIPGDSSLESTSLPVALRAVTGTTSPTLAPPAAEKAAFARLEE